MFRSDIWGFSKTSGSEGPDSPTVSNTRDLSRGINVSLYFGRAFNDKAEFHKILNQQDFWPNEYVISMFKVQTNLSQNMAESATGRLIPWSDNADPAGNGFPGRLCCRSEQGIHWTATDRVRAGADADQANRSNHRLSPKGRPFVRSECFLFY